MEDLIAREDVVVTITRTGYAKRTKVDLYRSQKRGGKGVSGATLRQDDIVSHFFVCSTHDWILFFTNKGRVYRAKAYELPEASPGREGPARRQPAGVPARRAHRTGHRDPELPGRAVPGAGHQERPGQEDRAGGVRLQPDRRHHRASTCATRTSWWAPRCSPPEDDLLLVSKQAQAIRFNATDEALRPMGRATSGVIGMRFGEGDELLAMEVVREG